MAFEPLPKKMFDSPMLFFGSNWNFATQKLTHYLMYTSKNKHDNGKKATMIYEMI